MIHSPRISSLSSLLYTRLLHISDLSSAILQETGRKDAGNDLLSPHIRKAMVSSPAVYRRAIFDVLHGGDSQTVGAVVSFLAAVLLNEGLQLNVLDSCGGSLPHPASNADILGSWALPFNMSHAIVFLKILHIKMRWPMRFDPLVCILL